VITGLTLVSARAAIVKKACTVGRVRRVYSRTVKVGRAISQYPRRGTTLSHGAPVDVVVSRGHR
jgi:beta-lactam-binding protein with PASTA domain